MESRIDSLLGSAKFTFFLGEKPMEVLGNAVAFKEYILSYTRDTGCVLGEKSGVTMAIIGICVDARGVLSAPSILDFLLDNGRDIGQLLVATRRLAGKYVILAHFEGAGYYAVPDAAATLPVYYYTGGEFIISSFEYLIASVCSLSVSETGKAIIKGQDNKVFPGEITEYSRVKCLLPNHYLDASEGIAVRFYPDGSHEPISPEAAAEHTAKLIRNIVKQYSAYGDFLCPITGGWDSRIALMFLLDGGQDIRCYTTRHRGFTDKSDDVWIPKAVTETLGVDYQLVEDLEAPPEIREAALAGFHYIDKSSTAYTHHTLFGDRIRVSGDIIGQIGKSAIGGDLPNWLGTSSFFHCKVHNYSKEARRETKKWRKGAVGDPYDLFALEIRCGRWGSKTESALSFFGVTSLNIVNCREVIETWMRVPRRDRIRKKLHIALFQAVNPELLRIPVNPGDASAKMKNIPAVFLAGTYLKYYFGKLRHIIRTR